MAAAPDAVILGRRSYAEWEPFWPDGQLEPFASFINSLTKYVATSAPLDPEWSHATAIDGDLADLVRSLKQEPGWASGSMRASRSPGNCWLPMSRMNSGW